MTSNELGNKVLTIIHTIMDNTHIDMTTDIHQVAFDSLRFIKFVVQIEKTFNIKFDDDYLLLHKYKTIGDICNYIVEKSDAKNA